MSKRERRFLREHVGRYYDVYFRLDAVYDAWADANNIPITELFVLYEISKQNVCTQTNLRERLGYSKQEISYILHGLEKKGLIFRQRAAYDRRINLLCFTAQGKKYANTIVAKLQNIEESAFATWTDEESEQILSAYESLADTLIKYLKADMGEAI